MVFDPIGRNVSEKAPKNVQRTGYGLITLSPKPHMRARTGCCSTRRLLPCQLPHNTMAHGGAVNLPVQSAVLFTLG